MAMERSVHLKNKTVSPDVCGLVAQLYNVSLILLFFSHQMKRIVRGNLILKEKHKVNLLFTLKCSVYYVVPENTKTS